MQSCGFKSCCPSCRKPCEPRQLLVNRIVENLVQSFKNARPKLLNRLLNKSAPKADHDGKKDVLEDEEPCRKERNSTSQSKGVAPERVKVPFYNQMKDKEVRGKLHTLLRRFLGKRVTS